jgi:hypothetical protein
MENAAVSIQFWHAMQLICESGVLDVDSRDMREQFFKLAL